MKSESEECAKCGIKNVFTFTTSASCLYLTLPPGSVNKTQHNIQNVYYLHRRHSAFQAELLNRFKELISFCNSFSFDIIITCEEMVKRFRVGKIKMQR